MKRYAFSLERVRRVRRTQEDIARARLQAAARQERLAEEDLRHAQQQYDTTTSGAAALRGLAMSALAAREMEVRRATDVREASQRLRQAEAGRAEATDAWTEAKRRVSALERLDERQRTAHERAVIAEGDALADDIVTGRFWRNR